MIGLITSKKAILRIAKMFYGHCIDSNYLIVNVAYFPKVCVRMEHFTDEIGNCSHWKFDSCKNINSFLVRPCFWRRKCVLPESQLSCCIHCHSPFSQDFILLHLFQIQTSLGQQRVEWRQGIKCCGWGSYNCSWRKKMLRNRIGEVSLVDGGSSQRSGIISDRL